MKDIPVEQYDPNTSLRNVKGFINAWVPNRQCLNPWRHQSQVSDIW